jgi:DNA repair exonuclease SbcCD ATPase subunit
MAAKKKLPVASVDDFDGVVLMRARTESIKRVNIVDLTFSDPLTLIGGDNSNGKTSYLDSIEWCFGGKAVIQMDPIHHGKQTGSVMCELGDGEKVALSITRTLKRVGEDEFTADVEVDIPGHVTPTRVQDFLDRLAGRIGFDPMAFDKLKAPDQFETLRKMVSGFDFSGNAQEKKKLYTERTNVNRDRDREQSAADAIVVSKTPPCDLVDEEALTHELETAGQKNAERATKEANRQRGKERISALRSEADALADRVIEAKEARANTFAQVQEQEGRRIMGCRQQIKLLEQQIVDAEQAIDAAQKNMEAGINADAQRLTEQAREQRAEADEIEQKIAAAGELPVEIPVADISAKLSKARTGNQQHAAWKQLTDRKDEHQRNANEHAAESESLTEQIDKLDAARQKAIIEAKLPVEGLGFGEDFITLNKVPWAQAGRAERVDASTAIAMALNPKLRTVLIRDGSDLGTAMRDRIRARAKEKGFKVLMEVIDESPNTQFVIENGLVKDRAAAGEAA